MHHGWPQLLEVFGGSLEGQRVLDVATNCGGFAIRAADAGAEYVLGVDIVDKYLEQANFVREARELENLDFRKVDVYDLSKDEHGEFDIVLNLGILYHLKNPVLAMEAMGNVATKAMLVDTTLMRPRLFNSVFKKRKLWLQGGAMERDSGCDTTNLWRQERMIQFTPTIAAVESMLDYLGFDDVRYLPPVEKGLEQRYYREARGTFLALRDT